MEPLSSSQLLAQIVIAFAVAVFIILIGLLVFQAVVMSIRKAKVPKYRTELAQFLVAAEQSAKARQPVELSIYLAKAETRLQLLRSTGTSVLQESYEYNLLRREEQRVLRLTAVETDL